MLGEPGGFGADAHHRGPDKGRGAAARAGAQARIAEGGFRELDARGEGAGIGAIRLAQIPDLEQVAVVQVGLALGEGFHEHPGGAGVAEIEHEIHVHGRQVAGSTTRMVGTVPLAASASRSVRYVARCSMMNGVFSRHVVRPLWRAVWWAS